MRLKKASLTFAGAAAAVAITTMAASPAWACSDRDPALKLKAECGQNGPNWMVTNPNGWGAVPFTWVDAKGVHSEGKINAPAHGSVALTTHADKVVVIAYRPDRRNLPVWERHGAAGFKKCDTASSDKPSPPPTKAAPKPTKPTSAAPSPTERAPSGEAGPATPVKAQPQFTG